jgi:hypothetical protein
MIVSISDIGLAAAVAPVLRKYPKTFVQDIELARCKNDVIARTIGDLKTKSK